MKFAEQVRDHRDPKKGLAWELALRGKLGATRGGIFAVRQFVFPGPRGPKRGVARDSDSKLS